jgi:hypothetical protein
MNEFPQEIEKILANNNQILSTFEEWILTQPHIPKTIRKMF